MRSRAAPGRELELGKRSYDVVAVGEALVDLLAPQAPDLRRAEQFTRAAGGAPANVAVAVARLGGHSVLVSALGADPFADYVRGLLRENGVDTRAVKTVGAPTTLALVARNTGGIPDFVFYRGSDRELTPADIPRDIVGDTHFLYVSSMALLTEPSRSATLAAVATAREMGALVSVDPNLRPSSWPSLAEARARIGETLDAAHLIKVNDEEARILTGQDDVGDALRALGRDDALTIVTLGEGGCLWQWHGQAGHLATLPVTVVDTTGAGDAFTGALLASLAAHETTADTFESLDAAMIVSCLRFACAAGALACTTRGAIPALPTGPEVEALLRAELS